MIAETRDLEEKEDFALIKEEMLINESNELMLELELKEYNKDELHKNSAGLEPDFARMKYHQICEEIGEIKRRLPVIHRQIQAQKNKLEFIEMKKKEREKVERDVDNIKSQLEDCCKGREDDSKTLIQIYDKLEVARKIHLYKTSPDVMEKIFHDQDVQLNNSRLPGLQSDSGTAEWKNKIENFSVII